MLPTNNNVAAALTTVGCMMLAESIFYTAA